MKPYEKLAYLYDKDWGAFSSLYLKLVEPLKSKYAFEASTALDIACGTGKLAAEFHKLGYIVSGIDLSEEMLKVARKNNPVLEYTAADMRNFELDKKFDLITCAFDSLNYLLEAADVANAFRQVKHHLSEGGFFIFDINTPTLYEDKHFGVIERECNGLCFRQILEYDRKSRIGKTTFDFGNGDAETHVQKAYCADEIEALLAECGFEVVSKFKDFELSPVDLTAYKVIFIAKQLH